MDELRKQLLTVGAIILGSVVLVWGLMAFSGSDSSDGDTTSVIEEVDVTPSDNILGDSDAPVQIVEFADMQCPACAQFSPIVKEIKDEYGDDVAVSFRHFPLISIHPNALDAAYATEAAADFDLFWEYHDLVYGEQARWSSMSKGDLKDRLLGLC